MIKINLIKSRKANKQVYILGIDVSMLKWKMIIFSIIIYYIPIMFLKDSWELKNANFEVELKRLKDKEKVLKKEIKGNQSIKEELNAYNLQIDRLKEKSKQVDDILREKRSPTKLLEKVAREIPEKLWLVTIELKVTDDLIISGGAEDYKSIGEFISNLNNSPFFQGSLRLESSTTEEEKIAGDSFRSERFIIKGRVVTYDQLGN